MSFETWYTIKPGEDNDISLSVAPNTFCKLSLSGKGKLKRSMKLLSDPDGHVHFTVRPSDASTEIIDFVLAYKQKSRVTHHILHLRIAKTAMQRMPFCKPIVYKVPSKAYRAALTPTQVLNMPDKELLSRGYPARPDEKKQPQAYRLWAASVSVKTYCIDAVSILDKDIMAVPEISNNWSGFKLLRPQGRL